jgi:hypothetical protein
LYLSVNGGIPVWVEEENAICADEVHSQPTDFGCQQEEEDPRVVVILVRKVRQGTPEKAGKSETDLVYEVKAGLDGCEAVHSAVLEPVSTLLSISIFPIVVCSIAFRCTYP